MDFQDIEVLSIRWMPSNCQLLLCFFLHVDRMYGRVPVPVFGIISIILTAIVIIFKIGTIIVAKKARKEIQSDDMKISGFKK